MNEPARRAATRVFAPLWTRLVFARHARRTLQDPVAGSTPPAPVLSTHRSLFGLMVPTGHDQ
jgi:hypothetical protein